jgi:hypothetical protein
MESMRLNYSCPKGGKFEIVIPSFEGEENGNVLVLSSSPLVGEENGNVLVPSSSPLEGEEPEVRGLKK